MSSSRSSTAIPPLEARTIRDSRQHDPTTPQADSPHRGQSSSLDQPVKAQPSRVTESELLAGGYVVGKAYFGRLPIAYHTALKFFRCGLCGTGVPNLVTHFGINSPHPQEVFDGARRRIREVAQQYLEEKPIDALPADLSPTNPYPAFIPGIELADGYSCNACSFCAPTTTQLQSHISAQHRGRSQGHRPCEDLQRIYGTAARSPWFPSSAPPRKRKRWDSPLGDSSLVPNSPPTQHPSSSLAISSIIPKPPQRTSIRLAQPLKPTSTSRPLTHVPSATELPGYITDDFDGLPIAYHPHFTFYLCTLCRRGVSNIFTHLLGQSCAYKDNMRTRAQEARLLERYPESSPYGRLSPSISPSNPHPYFIPGIKYAANGYGCPHCEYISDTYQGCNGHIRIQHDYVDHPVEIENIQQFSWGRSWFPSSAPGADLGTLHLPDVQPHPSALIAQHERTRSTFEIDPSPPPGGSQQPTLHTLPSPLTGRQTSPVDLPGFVLEDPLFGSLPIAYHPGFGFFHCTLCRRGIRRVRSHMMTEACTYEGEWTRVAEAALLARFPRHSPYDRLPPAISISNPYPTFIPGIDHAIPGYGCRSCPYISDKLRTLVGHYWLKHGQRHPPADLPNIAVPFVQRFFPDSPWFPSSPPASSTHPSSSASGSDPERAALVKRPHGTARQQPLQSPILAQPHVVVSPPSGGPSSSSPDNRSAGGTPDTSRPRKKPRQSHSRPSPSLDLIVDEPPLADNSLLSSVASSSRCTIAPERRPPSSTDPHTAVATQAFTATDARIVASSETATLPADVQLALQTINQLKLSVEELQKKQSETDAKQIATEASLCAALERVREMEALAESGAAGRAAQQQHRAAVAEAAKKKMEKAKAAWEQARAEAEAASALAVAEAEDEEVEMVDETWESGDPSGLVGESLRVGNRGYESEEEEEETIEEDYIPLADIDAGDDDVALQRRDRGRSLSEVSVKSSRSSSYEAFQEAAREGGGA